MTKNKTTISLSKFIANAGVCSRRHAPELIKSGVVTVNGHKITEPGHKITEKDIVKVRKKIIKPVKKIYILLNKPKDYITTRSDQAGRKTVMDLIGKKIKESIYPVGRLDRNTTGLLFLTNDGELTQQLAHPRYAVRKMYHVTLNQPIEQHDINKIKKGVVLDDGKVTVDQVSVLSDKQKNQVKVVLHSGRYRVIRRLFACLGYHVRKLDRVKYAGLTKKGLAIGQWRYLTQKEVERLKKLHTD